MIKKILILVSILFIINSCSTIPTVTSDSNIDVKEDSSVLKKAIAGKWLKDVIINYTYKEKSYESKIRIYFPKSFASTSDARTLIGLHTYNGSGKDWSKSSDIKKQADKYNFIIVCPDMSTTIYESRYFSETNNRWAPVPGIIYIKEVLLPFLNESLNIAEDKEKTGIFGVSYGARGAVYAAELFSGDFGACAGLSGNYDIISMSHSKKIASVYGEYKKFKDRWKQYDNVIKASVNLKDTKTFLWHGKDDNKIRSGQSLILAITMKQLKRKSGGGYDLVFTEKADYGHRWLYWNKVLPDMMDFFDKSLR